MHKPLTTLQRINQMPPRNQDIDVVLHGPYRTWVWRTGAVWYFGPKEKDKQRRNFSVNYIECKDGSIAPPPVWQRLIHRILFNAKFYYTDELMR